VLGDLLARLAGRAAGGAFAFARLIAWSRSEGRGCVSIVHVDGVRKRVEE